MIQQEHLHLIVQLKSEPGFILLCDHLQAYVDDLADLMTDAKTGDDKLQRLNEWAAAKKILSILKTFPDALENELNETKQKVAPELTIDPLYLARIRAANESE